MRRLAVLLIAVLVATRGMLERAMWSHMLVQVPLLVVAGTLLAPGFQARARALSRWNVAGAAGLIVASSTMALWMVPRLLDAAVEGMRVDLLKMAMLVAAGVVMRLSWRDATTLVRVFVVGNATWMAATVGMLLLEAPTRLCVQYATLDQQRAGYGLIAVAFALVASAMLRIGTGSELRAGEDVTAGASRPQSPHRD